VLNGDHHVMTAGGRDPQDRHVTSKVRPATRNFSELMMLIPRGATVFTREKRGKRGWRSFGEQRKFVECNL